MNEERQPSRKEMAASRETLHSLPEERTKDHDQLEELIHKLETIDTDFDNFLTCTNEAMVFLDTNFCIRRFTQTLEKLLPMLSDELGRSIGGFNHFPINGPVLLADIEQVLNTLQPAEKEISSGDRWFTCRIVPSRTKEKSIQGVVVSFTDISAVKKWSRQVEIRERQQEIVAALGQMALTCPDLNLLFEKLVKDASRALDVPLTKILQLLDNRQELLLKAGVGWSPGLVGKATVGAGRNSQAGFTLTTQAPIIVEDLPNEQRFHGPPLLHAHQVVSGMSVIIGPIEAPWGVLGVHSKEPRSFTIDDVNFLQAISNVLYAAITSHKNQEKLRHEALRASLIREAAMLSGWSDSMNDALQACMDLVCKLTGWAVAHTYITSDAGCHLISTKLWHLPDEESFREFKHITEHMPLAIGDPSLPGRTAKEGKVRWIQNIHGDPGFVRTSLLPRVPLKGALAFPMKVEEKTVAIAEFFHTEEIIPTLELLDTIEILAEQFNRIFERRVALVRRERTQQRLEAIVQAAEVGTWELDLIRDNTEWNPQMYELFGIAPSTQPSGETFFQYVHPEDRDALRQILYQVKTRGTSYDHEFRIIQPNGRIRWLAGRGEVSRDSEGTAMYMRGINIDITAIKQAQEVLRQSKENLELRIAERTAVAEQRARQLRDLALQLLEIEEGARDRTAQIMHDELQQLLVALRMRFQAIREDLSSEWVEETDALIDQGLQSCRALVLDLSPPVLREAGILAGLRWLARQALENYGLSVHADFPDRDIELDQRIKGLLFRAVKELLFNVVKHSHANQARLIVGYRNGQLIVRIEDNGRGFNPINLHNPGKIEKNFGFGLFTLHERVTAMGGEFHIDSAPGKGTHIQINLPLDGQLLGNMTMIPKQLPDRPSVQESKRSDGIRVLVADDHATLRDGVISMLSRQPDMQVVGEVANGQEAIDHARRDHPDVIVMDINMPGMNGIDATRRIKEEMPRVLVIGLSMHDDPEMIQSMNNAGASEFVSKGKPLKQLIEAIRRVTAVSQI